MKAQTSQLFITISQNMCKMYPSLDVLEFVILLTALVPVCLVAHHSIYLIIDRY